ncbi:MAG TPA: type II secretion system protein GspE, partial [bacterium]
KQSIEIPDKVLTDLGMDPEEASEVTCYKGEGCSVCNGTGYKGRMAIYEVMPLWEEIKEQILNGASAGEIKKEAVRLGLSTLRFSGLTKVKEGMTTTEEISAITAKD